ncbi:hypothetical protein DFQ28_009626 [Apophysomyces sp. BC1034]|nr:hypothetical protein DFQ30_008793 [Apophysomyces sp. BC1015]KAG0180429.1 hypothetical protein DFQ29_000675 [Apophysomyces sp. BC1021]KAG0185270.1 hypothetical protein DFQ28_009626 [Apophysomyces sp. BC1034]
MASTSFRTSVWDPILIIAQIISFQSLYYIVLSLLLLVAFALGGTEFTLDSILGDQEIRTDTVSGWALGFIWLVNALLCIPLIVLIVQRAKLVLDFVLTLHVIHFICVWIHNNQCPTAGAWWIVQIVNVAVMTLGGEWAAMRREMKPILMANKKKQAQPTQPSSSSSNTAEEEQEWVHVKQGKRKQSDAANGGGDDEEAGMTEEGPLTTAVGKAKMALIQSAQRAAQRRGKKYEVIPLHDIEEGRPS